ncbi:hypothetical protein AAF712_007252 [Marasmius tenuissimus]|uniref:Uncharacterized protein n=1 Tax=Marasmius tenuissimus TaxID=585030 RepID=A0ABR2ZVK7_9AGAR
MSEASYIDYPRRVVIDDTHPRIRYSDSNDWTLDVGTKAFEDQGRYGPPLNRTMHGTKKKEGAWFEFDFEGDYILVRGARDIQNNKTAPTWTCYIDGSPIPSFPFDDDDQATHNNLCELGHMSRKAHKLSVNVTVTEPNDTEFWLDYLEYAPLDGEKGLSLDGVDGEGGVRHGGWIKIDSSDTSVNYLNGSSQWKDIGGGFNGTGKTSGTVQVKFNGTSISFFSFLEGSNATQPWSSSPARYHIDDAQDTSFTIPASKKMSNGQAADFQNQLLFNASDLSGDKEHELAITYEGVYDSDKPPIQWLVVDYFLVTLVGMVTTSPGKSKPTMGMIFGVAFGGNVGLVLLGLGVWFFMKRWKRNQREGVMDSPWYGGAGGPGMYMGGGHTYAAVTPFVPEDEHRPYVNPVAPWETAAATGAGAGVVGGRTSTSYPPEKQRYSNMSTSSSAPLLGGASGSGSGSGSRPQHSRHNQSQSGSVVTLSPPDVESTSHHSYFDPYADASAGSSSNDNYRSMKGEQRQVVNTTYRRHEDSGVRYGQGSGARVEDLPPDYTRD